LFILKLSVNSIGRYDRGAMNDGTGSTGNGQAHNMSSLPLPFSTLVHQRSAIDLRTILLTAFFVLSLMPIVVGDESGVGVSVNYVFMLYPLGVALFAGQLRRPPKIYLFVMTFYALVFTVGAIYQLDALSDFLRRLSSFALFIGIFSFMFIRIEPWMVNAFKAAIVIAGGYFALSSVIVFFISGGSNLGFDAKNVVGNQRYGFVYLAAFWIAYLWRPSASLQKILKLGLTFIALAGLALTFSRASIVALLGSFAIFTIWSLRGITLGKLFKGALLTVAGGALAFFLTVTYFPVVLDFFDERLFLFLSNSNAVSDHLTTASTSEGQRLRVWAAILDYVSQNPLTGAGFLGVWIIQDEAGLASAHNQYFDVLFRTGVIGFLIYLGLLFQAARFLHSREPDLFWGLVGTFVYGFFHETFKESQGAFLLTFVLGMMGQARPVPPSFQLFAASREQSVTT
jgi:O-antigen ligase